MMEYKGYVGVAEVDTDAGLIHGEVVNTRDVITFQATNLRDLEKAFRASVDDYLAFCAKRGETPDKPFSGKFVLRLSPEVHRKAFIAARQAHKSVNAWVAETVEQAAERVDV
ncbi:MAG: type II toxin-antitoxin system HicB family antitoxin [Gammaproteobacteria bacterium]|nr:type II toxin-antitoxin system HicB family antitoxin [Gammaproteobacteria bacterium]